MNDKIITTLVNVPRRVTIDVFDISGAEINLNSLDDVRVYMIVNGRTRPIAEFVAIENRVTINLSADDVSEIGEYSFYVAFTNQGEQYRTERRFAFSASDAFFRDASGVSVAWGAVDSDMPIEVSVYTPVVSAKVSLDDLTPEQIDLLQQPAREAADVAFAVAERTQATNIATQATNQTAQENEATRTAGEQQRVANEESRNAAEVSRVKAEGLRVDNEELRENAEVSRVAAEGKRQTDTAKAIEDCEVAADRADAAASGIDAKIGEISSEVDTLQSGLLTVRDSKVTFTQPDENQVCLVLMSENYNTCEFGDLTAGVRHNGSSVNIGDMYVTNGNEFAGVWVDKIKGEIKVYDKYARIIEVITDERVQALDLTMEGRRQFQALEYALFNFNLFENQGSDYFKDFFNAGEFKSYVRDSRFFGSYMGRKLYNQGQPKNTIDADSMYGDTGRALKILQDGDIIFNNSWLGGMGDIYKAYMYKLTFTVRSGSITSQTLGLANRVCRRVNTRELATYPLQNGVEYECFWTGFSQSGGSMTGLKDTIVDFKIQERIPLTCYIMVDRTSCDANGEYYDFYAKKKFKMNHSAIGSPYEGIADKSYYKNGQLKVEDNDVYMCVDVTTQLSKKITQ